MLAKYKFDQQLTGALGNRHVYNIEHTSSSGHDLGLILPDKSLIGFSRMLLCDAVPLSGGYASV